MVNLCSWALGRLLWAVPSSASLELLMPSLKWYNWRQRFTMARRLLESYCCNQKIIGGCQGLGRCCKKVADQASAHSQLNSAGRPSFSVAWQTASRMQFSDIPSPLSTRLVATKSPKLWPQKILMRYASLKWSQLLQVDPRHQFMGAVTKELENLNTYIQCSWVDICHDKAIVEVSTACTLAYRLIRTSTLVYCVGKKTFWRCCYSEQWGNKPYWQETCPCHQRKSCSYKAVNTLFVACWAKGKQEPLSC